jgi:hypothetical protein
VLSRGEAVKCECCGELWICHWGGYIITDRWTGWRMGLNVAQGMICCIVFAMEVVHEVGWSGHTPDLYLGEPVSKFFWDTDYPDWRSSWFSSFPPGNCSDNTLNYAMTTSFHIISTLSLIYDKSFHAVLSVLLTPWLQSADANYTDRATAACHRS